jgi:hypothetical protein
MDDVRNPLADADDGSDLSIPVPPTETNPSQDISDPSIIFSCLLEIDERNSLKDSLTIAFFFLICFTFLKSENILPNEGHKQQESIDFALLCGPRLKHASFKLTPLDVDICPIKILFALEMGTGLIRTGSNISFDAAITHTYRNHSYVLHRIKFPFTRIVASTPGMATDSIPLFSGFVTRYDELFVSISIREDVDEFYGIIVTFLHDSGAYSQSSRIFSIVAVVSSSILFIFTVYNYWSHRKCDIPSEVTFSLVLAGFGVIAFSSVLFEKSNSFFSQAVTSAFSCLCRAMIIWLIIHLYLPESSRMTIMLTLLSSAVATVEMSEAAIVYAPTMNLAQLQFPLVIIYDVALLSACIWAQFVCTEHVRYRLTIYTVIGFLIAVASTFIGLRLGDLESLRTRSSLYLMKRAVMFGFLGCDISLHTIVDVKGQKS